MQIGKGDIQRLEQLLQTVPIVQPKRMLCGFHGVNDRDRVKIDAKVLQDLEVLFRAMQDEDHVSSRHYPFKPMLKLRNEDRLGLSK